MTVTVNYEAPADTTPPVIHTKSRNHNHPISTSYCLGATQEPWLLSGNIMLLESVCPGGTIVDVKPALTVTDDVALSDWNLGMGPDCDSPTNFSSPGDTTVTCQATDAAGNVGSISFTVRVFIQGAPTDTTPFTTVSSIDSQGNTCIGYENAPAGTTHVRVIHNDIGQNASSMNTYLVDGGSLTDVNNSIDSYDEPCFFNSSQLHYFQSYPPIPSGYWWFEAFDDTSSYTVMGYGQTPSGSYADYEGTSTQIFLETIPLQPSAHDLTPPVVHASTDIVMGTTHQPTTMSDGVDVTFFVKATDDVSVVTANCITDNEYANLVSGPEGG